MDLPDLQCQLSDCISLIATTQFTIHPYYEQDIESFSQEIEALTDKMKKNHVLLLTKYCVEKKLMTLNFWRDLEGREVDWVLSCGNKILPIEVKWTDKPAMKDLRHLNTFLNDYRLKKSFVVCRIKKATISLFLHSNLKLPELGWSVIYGPISV
ncbi:MAG: DUF4143 domain-containing protein [Pseudomonadota bacterium]|nr:DUF4143 domain-containing protein [Gammaproteobacteria bacterium]